MLGFETDKSGLGCLMAELLGRHRLLPHIHAEPEVDVIGRVPRRGILAPAFIAFQEAFAKAEILISSVDGHHVILAQIPVSNSVVPQPAEANDPGAPGFDPVGHPRARAVPVVAPEVIRV